MIAVELCAHTHVAKNLHTNIQKSAGIHSNTHSDLFDGAFVALFKQAHENIQNYLKHIHMQTIETPAFRQSPFLILDKHRTAKSMSKL